MRLVWGTVARVAEDGADLQRLRVLLDGATRDSSAICYPALAGRCREGERVLLNTTAVDLALGTGGDHYVVARSGEGGTQVERASGGHIMKLRYTPLQTDVLAVEEEASPHHEVMREATSLDGMPVVCCSLHSQMPLVASALKERAAEGVRVAYVMTDQAALPIALSGLVKGCRERGLIDTTITCGQSFGGDLEAVNLHSALLAARHVARADAAIVAIGPGVVGTGTSFGHGGVAQGEAVNAAAVLGGRAVVALRISFADPRGRHQGVSHHSLTALRVALAPAVVPVPDLGPDLRKVEVDLRDAGVWDRHVRVDVAGTAPDLLGLRVTTMGRTAEQDPAFFAAAAGAGEGAALLLAGSA